MGEIADGIINGDFDENTGEWLGKGQGFPRTRNGKPSRTPLLKEKKPTPINYREEVIKMSFKDKYILSDLRINELITDFAINSLGLSTNIGIGKASKHCYYNLAAFEKWLLIMSIA